MFAFGLKIGRRSADMILMDFVGGVRAKLRRIYAYPTPREILAFVQESIAALEASMTPLQLSRLAGIGVATPFELWNWADNVGAPQGEMDAWRDFDLRAEIQALTQYPVYLQNDATSACGAELMFGQGKAYPDYVYYFIGTFIGGGVVLNSSVFTGARERPARSVRFPFAMSMQAAAPAHRCRLDLRAREPAEGTRHRFTAALVFRFRLDRLG